ncbi:phosphoesterase [Nanobdella aerobiophila]|uniref:Phosphoesterase n=1 Tax=Nanobdella aerobiophila TaxID=2586965 RepID=A0A915SK85_9ARCH|nr:hypothetical protein [Nanobdella aerobiophila]BBL45488.1 phosphoesterase [Nanobdella aerobiophila]
MNNRFLSYIEDLTNKIEKEIENNKSFLIFSSLNPDGISSSILLLNSLYRKNAEVHLTYIDSIKYDEVRSLLYEKDSYEYDNIFFIDTGSIFSDILIKMNKDINKKIYIIDHHYLVSKDLEINSVVNLNPTIFNLDSYKEVSTSNILYYISKNMSHNKELLYLSLIGNIYDFSNINNEILNELKEDELIIENLGLNLPGIYKKPLYKSISNSYNFYIPYITGSDEKALDLLKGINVDKKGTANIMYEDVSEEDIKKIVSNIIKLKLKYNLNRTEDLIGKLYKINKNTEIGDLNEVLYSIESLIESKNLYGILYFLKKIPIDILKDSETIFRSNFSKSLYDIIENKFETINENGIKIIKIEKNYGNGYYISLLVDLLIKEGILKDKAIIVLFKNNNYYRGLIRSKIENKRIINNIIRRLFENKIISYSSFDNFGGFLLDINNYEEFIKSIKISLRQENII